MNDRFRLLISFLVDTATRDCSNISAGLFFCLKIKGFGLGKPFYNSFDRWGMVEYNNFVMAKSGEKWG
jgi:hypothetical protein